MYLLYIRASNGEMYCTEVNTHILPQVDSDMGNKSHHSPKSPVHIRLLFNQQKCKCFINHDSLQRDHSPSVDTHLIPVINTVS